MKKLLIILIILCITFPIFSQDIKARAVYFYSEFNSAPTPKRLLKVDNLRGFGGGFKAEISINEIFLISVSGGYSELKISQEEHALFSEWNWKAWQRYYGDINDKNFANATQWVQSVLKDTNYSAAFLPVQKMDYFPVMISVGAIIKPLSNLEIIPSFGAGVLFYLKRLYVEESWYKKFSTVNYTFGYAYRNMTENITGNAPAVESGIDINYIIGEIVTIKAGASYKYLFDTGNTSYYHFPSKDLLNLKFGITLQY